MFKSRLLGVALVIACCISAVEALKPNDVCKGRQFFSHESCSCDATSSRKLLSMEDKKTIAIEFVRKHMEAAESGQVHYKDTVKKHLPWFQLQDKYAEEHTTIQDLLVHNSVFSILDALPFELGVFKSELEFVQALRHLTTFRDFREGHYPSTCNYIILGQVIEVVTKKSWFQYVKEVILDPLGMSNTYGRPADVANMDQLTSGHFICNGRTIGPFSYLNSTMVELSPSNNYAAAFSMVSSIDDMTKLSRALLHKDKQLFQENNTLRDMLAEHNQIRRAPLWSLALDLIPLGTSLTTNHILQIGVVLLANGFNIPGRDIDSYHIFALRSYLLRLFMDVPVETLNRDYQVWVEWADANFAHVPRDNYYFGGNPWDRPGIEIAESVEEALVGTYCATESPGYIGNVTIARAGHDLTLHYGAYTRRLLPTEHEDRFIWSLTRNAWTFFVNVQSLDGQVTISLLWMDFNRCDER
ncbi:hypothetical protein LEN26_017096 [Aphanomyces euteiches]|nr:hypothetical protein LEN26_017096 [Aphanomyces euteiches]KAH9114079.1 hypothetical protein AeMF1_011785 [Aphanomyces euteiches]KAH9189895.1 hypothetical protein AeNC1_008129 [Aphanomyces euteiches]